MNIHAQPQHYKKLFLYGSLISYILGMALTLVLALNTGRPITALFAIVSGVFIAAVLWYYHHHKNYTQTVILLLWTSLFFVAMRLILYAYSLDMIFLLIPPMVASVLLDEKNLKIQAILYMLFTSILLGYGYYHYPNHPFLHNESLVIIFSIFSFFIIAFSVVYHYSIALSYKQLEMSNHDKTLLLQEVHHRVKNNLNMMIALLGLQKKEYHSTETQHFIRTNILRLQSMALVHTLLYENKHLSDVNIAEYIEKLVHYILVSANDKTVKITIDIEPISLNTDTIIHLGIIVNELITNSLKHAFGTQEGEIAISLKKKANNITFYYSDNGKGTVHTEENEHFGLKLIKLSTKQLGGELNIESEHSTYYCTIVFEEK